MKTFLYIIAAFVLFKAFVGNNTGGFIHGTPGLGTSGGLSTIDPSNTV